MIDTVLKNTLFNLYLEDPVGKMVVRINPGAAVPI